MELGVEELKKAIGVIDSGVGGLTVAQEIMRQLPHEKIIYLGDTKRCPYGSRSEEEVIAFTEQMVDFLLTKGVKLIVIACNTATAFALNHIQKKIDIPIVGVIQPGARAAIKMTKSKEIAIIGTEGTINSQAYANELMRIDEATTVHGLACPLFVPMVEKGILTGPQAEEIVHETLDSFLKVKRFDTMILGCTHYPLLEQTIKKIVGKQIELISSSEETAREISLILSMHHMANNMGIDFTHEFYSTGNLTLFKNISHKLFSYEINVLKKVTIENAVLN